jgi:putative GTP pyrophosphokinase
MPWPTPQYSKAQVNKAGVIIAAPLEDIESLEWALNVLDNWRSCHGYPINTFQATLRKKLRSVDADAIVAQRLKRLPSIISKLRRFDSMQLARMQDIGGLRAVLSNLAQVRLLEENYRESHFSHELVASKDYIAEPKQSGYRSIHLIYRYRNPRASDYNGLLLELQLRTRLQHAWATAVETMGIFLNHALKSSEGPDLWLNFFALAGSAFAHLEDTPPVPMCKHMSAEDTFRAVTLRAGELEVTERLQAFSVAAEQISEDRRSGSYHLIALNLNERTVMIRTFSQSELGEANKEYSATSKMKCNSPRNSL